MASELESTDVRPLPVLWRTQQYLLGLLDDPEFSFNIVHNFLFDRTRAIRQELGMQRILDHQSVTIHEEIVSTRSPEGLPQWPTGFQTSTLACSVLASKAISLLAFRIFLCNQCLSTYHENAFPLDCLDNRWLCTLISSLTAMVFSAVGAIPYSVRARTPGPEQKEVQASGHSSQSSTAFEVSVQPSQPVY